MTADGELRKKICELQDKFWANAKGCIRKYNMVREMERQFSPKVNKMQNISGGTSRRSKERSKEKYRPGSKDRNKESNKKIEKERREARVTGAEPRNARNATRRNTTLQTLVLRR